MNLDFPSNKLYYIYMELMIIDDRFSLSRQQLTTYQGVVILVAYKTCCKTPAIPPPSSGKQEETLSFSRMLFRDIIKELTMERKCFVCVNRHLDLGNCLPMLKAVYIMVKYFGVASKKLAAIRPSCPKTSFVSAANQH